MRVSVCGAVLTRGLWAELNRRGRSKIYCVRGCRDRCALRTRCVILYVQFGITKWRAKGLWAELERHSKLYSVRVQECDSAFLDQCLMSWCQLDQVRVNEEGNISACYQCNDVQTPKCSGAGFTQFHPHHSASAPMHTHACILEQ